MLNINESNQYARSQSNENGKEAVKNLLTEIEDNSVKTFLDQGCFKSIKQDL